MKLAVRPGSIGMPGETKQQWVDFIILDGDDLIVRSCGVKRVFVITPADVLAVQVADNLTLNVFNWSRNK